MEAGQLSIVHVPTSRPRWKNPLLFVPGAFTGAWLWKDTFMPYAAAHGFDTWAVTFKSHGRSGWPLHSLGLRDYLEDLQSAVNRLPAKPVLVAHSLGAWVTYHFARQHAVKALVLISPVPADGILSLFLPLVARDPWSAFRLAGIALYPPVRWLSDPPAGIYSADVDQAGAARCTSQLRGESWRALAEACVPWPLTKPSLSVPTLVIGFTGDGIVPAEQARRTARQLGADLQIQEGFSHTPTVEHNWERVAHDMLAWVRRLPGIRSTPRSPRRGARTASRSSTGTNQVRETPAKGSSKDGL